MARTATPRPDRPRAPVAGPLSKDLEQVERLADLMDTAIRVPIIGYRIGLDGLLGLIPGVGDALALAPAGYILFKAKKMGVPNHLFARMVLNTGVDAAVGTVPLVGDIFDFVFKSNRKNVDLLRRHVQERQGAAPPAP